ncbi:hypothetical protein SAMN03080594_11134 [Arenibacter palladensis]|uniref:Uncharacterized protein n=1 Tax=Arenibacter palladensis TaxID=237373 RepID=A0A1M5GFA1_9FLAO|nr:hypothetical protein SAMN03080594_11134 [Arenibacter palladensis]
MNHLRYKTIANFYILKLLSNDEVGLPTARS